MPIPLKGNLFPDWNPPGNIRPLKKGHAGQPGTGPEGETCKTCEHYVKRVYSGTFRKCHLTIKTWTKGKGSDIRAGDPACEFWENKVASPENSKDV
tara:strand:+ start:142 stop:429 length:288 start_codon:yes stop_codon:yes gene_type:complete